MSHPPPRDGGRSRDDLPPPRHFIPCHPTSPSRGDGVPAGSATDSLRQPPRLSASPHAGVDGRSARQVGPAQQRQLSSRHPASPQQGKRAASPPCSNSALHLPTSSNSGVEGGSTRAACTAADFLAIYNCCVASGLKACLTFIH
jgi:hypothetical protein